MTSEPQISVIIPVYKVEKYLRQCVDSILSQTFKDLEIILVDDGSPDFCPEICDEYAGKHDNIIVVHKENGGLGNARNTGLDNARGKYVCFIDSDDYLRVNTLDYCFSLAENLHADEVRYMFHRFTDKDEIITKPLVPADEYVIATGPHRLEPILEIVASLLHEKGLSAETTASSCSALYRRSVIEENHIRFFSERELMSEDYIFNIDFGTHCKKIIYTSNEFYCYRINTSSLTRTVRKDRIQRSIKFSEFLARRLESYGFPDPDLFAMGYTVGEMRTVNRLTFHSNLSFAEKRAAFEASLAEDYVKRIIREYPVERLSLMPRVAFALHIRHLFWLSYLVVRVRELWKE